jgi:hypothetical protein
MRIKSVLIMLNTASCVAMMCGLFVPSAFAHDDWGQRTFTCSNETFKGDYAFTVNGVVLPGGFTVNGVAQPAGTSWPIQGVQLIHSDGDGTLTDIESLVVNGFPLPNINGEPAGPPPGYFSLHTGTYSLSSDCTGTAFETDDDGFNFVHLAIVVDKGGRQVRMVVVPPFDKGGIPRVITAEGEKVEP